jgi:hypothetical protein
MNGSESSHGDAKQMADQRADQQADDRADKFVASATVSAAVEEGVIAIPLKVFTCCYCTATYFPARSLCATCGKGNFVEADGEQGWIEQWTELRQSPYQLHHAYPGEPPPAQPAHHYLATVRTAAGPRVIAAMTEAGVAGIAVTLCHVGERLIARRKVPL